MTTPVKAFLVHPLAGTIRPVVLNGETRLSEIRELIGCTMIDMVRMDVDHSIILDDNGLHDGLPCVTHLKGYDSPLAGNLLVVGTDEMGDTVDVSASIDDLAMRLTIVRPVLNPVLEPLSGPTVFGTRLSGFEVNIEKRSPTVVDVQCREVSMSDALEIRRFVVVSTSLVSGETAKMLDRTPTGKWPCAGGPYADYGCSSTPMTKMPAREISISPKSCSRS